MQFLVLFSSIVHRFFQALINSLTCCKYPTLSELSKDKSSYLNKFQNAKLANKTLPILIICD